MVYPNTIYTQHFSLNRILLLAVGLWPFERSRIIQFQLILFVTILITFPLFQFTTFLTFECTADFVIRILSSAFFFIALTVKYNSFCVNIDTIKHSMKLLQRVCNELQNENEVAIIKKYSEKAKFYTMIIILLAICTIFSTLFLQLWLHFRHFLFNESQSHASIYFMTEYFINREKYSYLITLHTNAAFWIGILAISATGAMLITYLQHVCGMFSIASFRIEQAMVINVVSYNRDYNIDYKNQIVIRKKMVDAISIHRKAMMSVCARFLISNFQGSYFFLILSGMVCLSSSLVRIMSVFGDIEQFMQPLVYINVCYIYLFLSNYIGQEIINHNDHVFYTAYNVQWYATSLYIQKIISILLQRGSRAFNLNIGGLFIGSMESAASLVSASISYFTVLYSMRQN